MSNQQDTIKKLKKVKRCLFGKPDPGATKKLLRDHIKLIQRKNREKWSFDFEQERPLGRHLDWQIENLTIKANSPIVRPNKVQKITTVFPTVPSSTVSAYFKSRTRTSAASKKVQSPLLSVVTSRSERRRSDRILQKSCGLAANNIKFTSSPIRAQKQLPRIPISPVFAIPH